MTRIQKQKLEDLRFELESATLKAQVLRARADWYQAQIDIARLKIELSKMDIETDRYVASLRDAESNARAKKEKTGESESVTPAKYTEADLERATSEYRVLTNRFAKYSRQLASAQREYWAARQESKVCKDSTLKSMLSDKADEMLAQIINKQNELSAIKSARQVVLTNIEVIRKELGLSVIKKLS